MSRAVIDNFALALIHALLAIAGWRLAQRDDLDTDHPSAPDEDAGGGNVTGKVRKRG